MSETAAAFKVGDWQVDPASFSVSRGGTSVRLSPRAMRVLILLARHSGAVVSRAQILDEVWPGRVVVDESVTQIISELRKALEDDRKSPRYIETIPKAGYRLISPTTTAEPVKGDTGGGHPSVAVLPFADLSEGHDHAYFCDGMADELIGALCQVPGLSVISRTASFAYRTATSNLAEIAQHLGVSHLVEGSVRRQGESLRITVRLIEIPRGNTCWSASFDRGRRDVFAIQDEIARQVARRLQSDVAELRQRRQPDVQAYDYYLRGREYFYRGGTVAGRLGHQMFRRAIEIDPNYALAHAGLADSYTFAWLYYYDDPGLLEAARESAEQAINLAPELAEAHTALGSVLSAANDYEQAARANARAIELSPHLFEPNYLFGRACLVAGVFDRAAELLGTAVAIRPESLQVYTLLARAYRALGDTAREMATYSRADDLVRHQLEVLPNDPRTLCIAAACAAALGAPDEARDYAERAIRCDDPMNFYAACALARAGFEDEALASLERACRMGWNHLAWLDNDPELAALRHTPRFQAVRATLAGRLPRRAP